MTVVVKLGSSIVADDGGELRASVLDSVCEQVGALHGAGENVAMVTSGAVACGMREMGLAERPDAVTVGEPKAALERAKELAGPGGAVLATGSIYLIADLVRTPGQARISMI